MKIPEEVIAKAYEGGLARSEYTTDDALILKAVFWQSLKLPWSAECDPMMAIWLFTALKFSRIILTGGDTKAFWDELLTPIEE